MSDEKIFMENVVLLRKRSGLTKKEMAGIMGIGMYSMNKLEQGIFPARLGVDAVFRMQRYFRIPAKDLFKKTE